MPISETAIIDATAVVHPTASVWHGAHIRAGAELGEDVIVSEGAYVGLGVIVGASTKIQNRAQIYEPAILEAGVFIGPGVILTNDRNPRAVNSDGSRKHAADWTSVGVVVRHGASIGAGAICVAPVEIGTFALIAAGAVVTHDVRPFALVAGNPARQIGWVGAAGARLAADPAVAGVFTCPVTQTRYLVTENGDLRLSADQA